LLSAAGCGEGSETIDGDRDEEEACIPNCEGKVCGWDGCAGYCGECGEKQACNTSTGRCVEVPPMAGCGDMAGLQSGAPWPMPGYCRARVNASPFAGPEHPTVKWCFEEYFAAGSDVLVDKQGGIFACGDECYVLFPKGNTFSSMSAVSSPLLSIETGEEITFSWDEWPSFWISDGNRVLLSDWFDTIDDVVFPAGPSLYYAYSDFQKELEGIYNIYALSTAGDMIWSIPIENPYAPFGTFSQTPDGQGFIVLYHRVSLLGAMLSFGRDGTVKYFVPCESCSKRPPTVFYDVNNDSSLCLKVFHRSAVDGNIASLAGVSMNGDILWNIEDIGNPATNGDYIYALETDLRDPRIVQTGWLPPGNYNFTKAVVSLDSDGNILWKTPIHRGLWYTPLVDREGTVYVGNETGTLNAIGHSGKLRWSLSLAEGDVWPQAITADGSIIILSDGALCVIGEDD
ncbi:MAG: hypothetical protein C4523_12710, partial [Myxococcales bacterium]